MKHLELTDTELGYLLTGLTSAMVLIQEGGHKSLMPKYQSLYDKVHNVKTSCPASVLVPSLGESGAPSLPNLDLFDDDLPPVFIGGKHA